MIPQEQNALQRAVALAEAGHMTAAIKLIKPLAKAGSAELRFALIELYFQNYMIREAAVVCRELLALDPDHARARLYLCESLLMMGLCNEAADNIPKVAPEGQEIRWSSVAVRVRFAALRQRGAEMWAAGEFDDGKAFYERLQEEEAEFRAEFRAILDECPDNKAAWDLLVDMVGNYRVSYAMAQALPDLEAMRRRYIETVAGRADHPAQRHRHVVAATFQSLREPWPIAAEIVATIPAAPRHYQPARFGGEAQPLLPVDVAPRQVVRLREAMVYDAGIYMMLRAADGNAPWLLEGVWGKYITRHITAVIPGQQCFFEGVGMGTTVCTLPAPTLRIEEPVVVLGYWNNYGHFLHDVLPQLQDAETALGRDFKILATDAILPPIRDAFAKCGYGPDRIVTIGERRTATLREAYCLTPRTSLERIRTFTTPMSHPFWHYDMALDDAGVRFVRDRLLPAKQQPATRKIYTSRRKTQRKPFNEEALEAMLAAQGFEILVPDAMSLAEQIELFNSAAVLIAVEGASLANTIFMQPGAKVMVLRSLVWGWTVNCFDELARINKLDLAVFDFEGRNIPVDALRAQLIGWLARAA